ncbi:MAG: tetratricopeptide repeat protein [Planctomycetota bacterium]
MSPESAALTRFTTASISGGMAELGKENRPALLAAAACLSAVGGAAYYNSFEGVFLFDDIRNIVQNDSIHRFWPLGGWFANPENIERPVVTLTLAANYRLGGLNVWGYHAFNLGVHLLAALTLFGIVRRTLLSPRLRERFGEAAAQLALCVALLWLVHPLQTEAVTYIWQRCESLMGLFFLLTLYCVIRGFHAARPGWWHAGAVCCCLLGAGCKQVIVMALPVVLLYDLVFLSGHHSLNTEDTKDTEEHRGKDIGKNSKSVPTKPSAFHRVLCVEKSVLRRWRLYAGLGASWILVALLLLAGPSLETGTVMCSRWEYARTQPGVIQHYLRLAIWPDTLCLDYWWTVANTVSEILPGALTVAGLLAATGWALWRAPAWGFLGAWFFLILAPTSSLMPIDLAFEHRMYLPLAAVAVAVVCGAFLLSRSLLQVAQSSGLRRKPEACATGSPCFSWLALALAGCAVLALSCRTAQRNEDYQSEFRMWSGVLAQRPGNPHALNNVGLELYRQKYLDAAIAYFQRALKIKPEYAAAHNNLGNALFKEGQLDEALTHYREALKYKPNYAEAHYNLSLALAAKSRLEKAGAH